MSASHAVAQPRGAISPPVTILRLRIPAGYRRPAPGAQNTP
jgi:hypothetical protein